MRYGIPRTVQLDGELSRQRQVEALSGALSAGAQSFREVAAKLLPRDAPGATKKAFTDLVRTTFGIAQGNGVADVQKWFADQQDGESHSGYVGGWRVDLVVKYGTASGANDYELTVRGDARWTVPSQ